MKNLNYGRAYQLTITRPDKKDPRAKTSKKMFGGIVSNPKDQNLLVEYTERSKTFTDLDITFSSSIETRFSGSVTKGTLQIMNLSEESVSFVSSNNNFVTLKAGYGDREDLPLVFTGAVKSCKTYYNGSTLITELALEEASHVVNAVRVSFALPPKIAPSNTSPLATSDFTAPDGSERPTTYLDVLSLYILAFVENGVSISSESIFITSRSEHLQKNPQDTFVTRGYTFDGYLRDGMEKVCKALGYTFYINRNVLYVHPIGFTAFSVTSKKKIIPSLIKDVQIVEDQASGLMSRKSLQGINLSTFLDGTIKTDTILEIPELPRAYKKKERALINETARLIAKEITRLVQISEEQWDSYNNNTENIGGHPLPPGYQLLFDESELDLRPLDFMIFENLNKYLEALPINTVEENTSKSKLKLLVDQYGREKNLKSFVANATSALVESASDEVERDNIQGNYVVRKVEYKLATRGDRWDTIVFAERLSEEEEEKASEVLEEKKTSGKDVDLLDAVVDLVKDEFADFFNGEETEGDR